MARTLERRSGDTRENRVPARARRAVSAVPGLLCALLLFGTGTARGGGSAVPQEAAPGTAPPLCFVANRGQSGRGVDYYVREGASTVSFARGGVTFFLSEERRQQRWALKLDFVGAEPTSPVGEDLNASEASGVGDTCGRLVYRDLWPGIDLVYTGDEGRLKYSFVIRPGADPGRIEMAYRGATGVRVTSDGRLTVSTPTGRLEEERPYAYQEAGGERLEVKAAFALGGDGPSDTRFGFRVGSYDASRPLILDPVIKLIGFETQDASEIASLGTPTATINNTNLRPGSGSRNLRQSTTATVLASGLTPALNTLGLRFSFRTPNTAGASQMVLLMTGATTQWALQLSAGGLLQVQDLAGLTFVGTTTGSTPLANLTWYTVQLAYDAAAGGTLQVWLDGSLEISITHSAAGTAVDQIQVLGRANPAYYYYDDFYLADTATQPPLGQIVRIGVNGTGYRSDFDVIVPGTGTDRDLDVNEIPPSDANYNGHTAATVATDLYALQSSPAGTINAVKGMWRMRGSAVAVGGTHDYAWRIQGIEASQAFAGLGAAWTLMEVVWSTPPSVGGTWTQAEVDGLELGARHNGTHAEDTYISWTAAMVDYVAGGGTGALTCSAAAHKPWYNASWTYRQAILVDHTKVVGDLVDFPMLVSRSGDADLAAHARPDGFDILFTDEDGTTKLSHQREAYDGAGNLVAWVKVPLLPTGADKVIFMYYGNPSSPDQQSANATWSNGYRAVWHLSEASGAGAYIRNSAVNNYHGTPTNTAFNASGKIDGARAFSNVGYSNVAISNSGALFNAWSQFSFETWIYPDYASDAIWEGEGEDEFLYGNTGPVELGRVRRFNYDPAGTGELQIDVHFNTAPWEYVADSINRSAWNHIVYTYQGSDFQVFFNGVEVYRDVVPDDRLTAASYILLGIDSNAGSLNGSLDEVRISNAGRSSEWIKTEYANQNAPATFCSVCGAQDVATTAVGLASFTARGFESAVLLEWETASELDNLGFHLYRGVSADGPWTKLNASMIPGLGSSPEGKQYRYVDAGLANGTTYFYRLEDVDRHGRITSHGPVSATPLAGVAEPGEGGGSEGPAGPPHSPTPKPAPERKTHGDPTQQSLRVLERTAFGVTLELVTGGFYSQEQEDGTSKLLVPGFFDRAEPGLPHRPHPKALDRCRRRPRGRARLRRALRPRLLLRPERLPRRKARRRRRERRHLPGLVDPRLAARRPGAARPGGGSLPRVPGPRPRDRVPGRAEEGLRGARAPAGGRGERRRHPRPPSRRASRLHRPRRG